MIRGRAAQFLSFVMLTGACVIAPAGEWVNQSAREIPLAYNVDVVVVGGGTGAVSAAVAAAQEGAKVFLAAPHPYLGDDMTATLRLWLEEGETPASPLAQKLFRDPIASLADPNRLDFTYQADSPSAAIHRDTDPPSRLTDGQWSDASRQSVQYERDTNIVADLGQVQEIRAVRLMAFRRREGTSAGTGFDVRRVTVFVSNDGETWKQAAAIENTEPMADRVTLLAEVGAAARYVKLFVEKPDQTARMLLGEIEILGPERERQEIARAAPPRPLHVKRTLDDALLEAGVQFLYSCYATDVLRDASGGLAGIVMANRSGRQAVVAKTIVDATPRALVARLAGARFRPYPVGTRQLKRVVIGGAPVEGDSLTARIAAPAFHNADGSRDDFAVVEYSIPLEIPEDSCAALMRAEQRARTLTYDPQQQFTSDLLFEVPPDAMHGRETSPGPWRDAASLPLGALQPEGLERLYVLGGCADVSREQAERLLRPLALMDLGERLGCIAAQEAASRAAPRNPEVRGEPTRTPASQGDVREPLLGVRPTQELAAVPQQETAVPVLGKYDVVVVGGGTGGAPAGIAAARQGARTLVVEYLHGLGGVGTLGAISKYYWGNRVGFTATVQEGETGWTIEQKMEWYRQELLQAGADIWFGAIGCGAFVQDHRVAGVVIATPYGRGVVLAHAVIDATGNSDVAAAAGAECLYTDASEFAMQGTGLPGRKLAGSYNNTDFTIVDETDMIDVWRTFVFSKGKYPDAFDHGQLIDTRERRRIVGDFTIKITDQINERTYPDSVVRAWSNFDTHGYTVDPYLLLEHPEKKGIGVYIPYRAMLPRGWEGVLVIGLGVSAHRDAVPLIRMQPDIQNGGYAAGLAAAMAAEANVPLRKIDIRQLQRRLIEIGNLPESVLTDVDSYPLSDERIAEAVKSLEQGRGAAVIMTAPERATPLLQAAYRKATGDAKLIYAKALAVLGNDEGLDTLLAKVRETDQWDEGWNYKGMGQFGQALSPLDHWIVALGRAGNRRAVPVILEKVRQLDAESDFSHHRAVGLALELLGDPAAAQPLAELLSKPDMTDHAQLTIELAKQQGVPGGTNSEQARRESLRELLLARALYRCGDYQGRAVEILRSYVRDLRGHLARHAKAVLEQPARPPQAAPVY